MPVEKSAGAIIFRRENDKIYYLSLHYPPSSRKRDSVGKEEGKPSSATRAKRRGGFAELRSSLTPRFAWTDEAPASAAKAPKPRSRVNSLRGKEYWDLPKGHIKKGEKEIETVRREVEEETGLKDIEFVDDFKEWIKYFFKFRGKNILKFVTFYLAETKEKDIKVSFEHLGFEWLSYEKAIEKLTFQNAKKILKKANKFLSEKGEKPLL